jgi:hypothetical protein
MKVNFRFLNNQNKCHKVIWCKHLGTIALTALLIGCKLATQSTNLTNLENQPPPLGKEWGITSGTSAIPMAKPNHLQICSFNIQFLGSYSNRDTGFLADTVKNCDLVAVQELIGSPRSDIILGDQNQDGFVDENDSKVQPKRVSKLDPDAKAFFDAMEQRQFKYILSNTKTGKGSIEGAGNSAEFTVVFFKADKFEGHSKLVSKFIHPKIFENDIFDRVPYVIYLKSKLGGKADFGILSVHLHFLSKKIGIESDFKNLKNNLNGPGHNALKGTDEISKIASTISKANSFAEAAKNGITQKKFDQLQRFLELNTISTFIDQEINSSKEMDWLIIGDMNISSKEEIQSILKHLDHLRSLNPDNLFSTNVHMDEAFDHALVFNRSRSKNQSFEFPERLNVLNLLCRAALLEEPPPVKNAVIPKPNFSRRELKESEECSLLADEKFKNSSKFLAPMLSHSNQFWTEFRTRYSDHNPIYFEVPIPSKDKD